ncbi:hypothetical protein EVA_00971 [gut metagenome]|uniref:Uncharacterized protein n=1 Tax=gut metagenome TaxID=749906 RepID=J9GQH5_9ZZZZ
MGLFFTEKILDGSANLFIFVFFEQSFFFFFINQLFERF